MKSSDTSAKNSWPINEQNEEIQDSSMWSRRMTRKRRRKRRRRKMKTMRSVVTNLDTEEQRTGAEMLHLIFFEHLLNAGPRSDIPLVNQPIQELGRRRKRRRRKMKTMRSVVTNLDTEEQATGDTPESQATSVECRAAK
jgi:hypothetical protein